MWCLDLAAALGRLEVQGRSGEVDWRSDQEALDAALDARLDSAWRRGVALNSSLSALRTALMDAGELSQAVRSLRMVYYLRTAMGLAAALLVRFFLLGTRGLAAVTPRDTTAWLLAFAVLMAAQVVLSCGLPVPWLGRKSLNSIAYAWLEAHLESSSVAGAPQAAALQRMSERELGLGVSLRQEKRELLTQWSRDQLTVARQRLKRLEDLLPLFELGGVGLPLTLLLVEPLTQALG